jgi:hypothetical protein
MPVFLLVKILRMLRAEPDYQFVASSGAACPDACVGPDPITGD